MIMFLEQIKHDTLISNFVSELLHAFRLYTVSWCNDWFRRSPRIYPKTWSAKGWETVKTYATRRLYWDRQIRGPADNELVLGMSQWFVVVLIDDLVPRISKTWFSPSSLPPGWGTMKRWGAMFRVVWGLAADFTIEGDGDVDGNVDGDWSVAIVV